MGQWPCEPRHPVEQQHKEAALPVSDGGWDTQLAVVYNQLAGQTEHRHKLLPTEIKPDSRHANHQQLENDWATLSWI